LPRGERRRRDQCPRCGARRSGQPRPDLVLLDVRLGDLNGSDVCWQLATVALSLLDEASPYVDSAAFAEDMAGAAT